MPQTILNPTLYADRTVQEWHRVSFPSTSWAIDLDLLGACNRCREPLYLIESTTNPNKPVSILRNLARRSQLPAFIIWHDTEVVTGGTQIFPSGPRFAGAAAMGSALMDIRTVHVRSHGGAA